jgi:hypothetical protein
MWPGIPRTLEQCVENSQPCAGGYCCTSLTLALEDPVLYALRLLQGLCTASFVFVLEDPVLHPFDLLSEIRTTSFTVVLGDSAIRPLKIINYNLEAFCSPSACCVLQGSAFHAILCSSKRNM